MSSGDDDEWCLIESDPGVFTELLETLGCRDVEVEELWSLDDDDDDDAAVSQHRCCCYGLIFLFEWKGDMQREHAAQRQPLPEHEIPPGLFFARQVTTNACATQALLSVLFTASAASAASDDGGGGGGRLPRENLGGPLQEFAAFTAEFPPQLKGVAISGSSEILAAHNSFAVRHSFLNEGKRYDDDRKSGEAFHFVAYVPAGDTVYELDGLQTGPMVVGKKRDSAAGAAASESNNNNDRGDDAWWLHIARAAIRDRMQTLQGADGSVKFNLLRVGQDRRVGLRAVGDGAALRHEEEKRARWKRENERRRHNYVPLAVQVLRELARAQQLRPLAASARERQQRKRREAALLEKKRSSGGGEPSE